MRSQPVASSSKRSLLFAALLCSCNPQVLEVARTADASTDASQRGEASASAASDVPQQVDASADSIPDAVSPIDSCDPSSVVGMAGMACTFSGGCGVDSPGDATSTFVACLAQRIVVTYSTPAFMAPCDAGPQPDGACILYNTDLWDNGLLGTGNCTDAGARQTRICAAEVADDGRETSPWAMTDDASCSALVSGGAADGERCSGSQVCNIEWPVGDGICNTLVWCADNVLRVVAAQPGGPGGM
jgi:hypothetical protein